MATCCTGIISTICTCCTGTISTCCIRCTFTCCMPATCCMPICRYRAMLQPDEKGFRGSIGSSAVQLQVLEKRNEGGRGARASKASRCDTRGDLVVSHRPLPYRVLERLGLPGIVVHRHHSMLPLTLFITHAHAIAPRPLPLEIPAIVKTCARGRMRCAGQRKNRRLDRPFALPLSTPHQISSPIMCQTGSHEWPSDGGRPSSPPGAIGSAEYAYMGPTDPPGCPQEAISAQLPASYDREI